MKTRKLIARVGPAGAAAADTLTTVSGALYGAAEAARRTGMAVRDRCRDSARAVSRGGELLRRRRTSPLHRARSAVARHRTAVVGAAGLFAAGLVAAEVRRRNGG